MNDERLLYQSLEALKETRQRLAHACNKLQHEADRTSLSLSIAMAAAEKQIPYKPPVIYTGCGRPAYECKCGHILPARTAKYCDECGQRLDDRRETT